MVRQNLIESLNSAVEGFIFVLKTQRNMRLHFLMATLVIVLGIYFNLTKVELLILLGVIALVLAVEMINTSLELTIDLVKSRYHPLARVIKDIAAGAVFLCAVNAIITGYIIFSKRFVFYAESGIHKITQSPWHVTLIALIIVLFLVLVGKVLSHKGTPFRGGMPSGHAAFSFSIWMIIVFSTQNMLIIILAFILAFLIARHRVQGDVHNTWEVIAGSLFGILITTLVFQLLL